MRRVTDRVSRDFHHRVSAFPKAWAPGNATLQHGTSRDVIPAISVSAALEAASVPEVPVLLDHYEGALQRFGASVGRLPGNRLGFDVPWSRPKGLGRWEADLGLVSGGFSTRSWRTPTAR